MSTYWVIHRFGWSVRRILRDHITLAMLSSQKESDNVENGDDSLEKYEQNIKNRQQSISPTLLNFFFIFVFFF